MTYEEFCAHAPITREQFERLKIYHDLLLKWQARVNLVAPSTVAEAWTRHLLDSADLLPYLPAHGQGSERLTIADIGSGAGFPGLVLAILTDAHVTLIESDRKKCEFLKEAARVTGSDVTVLNQRVETIEEKTFDVIVSRATAKLETLVLWARPLRHAVSICLFHKGENWATEMDAAKQLGADFEVLPSKPGASGCIIKVTNL